MTAPTTSTTLVRHILIESYRLYANFLGHFITFDSYLKNKNVKCHSGVSEPVIGS